MIPIPLGDENPTSRRPLVNYALIAANGLFFLWFNVLRGQGTLEPDPADLHAWGLLPGHPTPLRFVTSMFMHAGPMHLLGNMWFLHIFGDNVEDKLGRWRYLLLYLAWGALASLSFLAFGRPFGRLTGVPPEFVRQWNELPLVGASGAISGVMGAYVVFFPRARVRMVIWLLLFIVPFTMPAFLVIGLYFFQDLLLGLLVKAQSAGVPGAGVAYAAHTGGMVTGILFALALKPWLRRSATATAWDRDTGFEPAGWGPPAGGDAIPGPVHRTIPLPDLRDQLVGAVLDGRMDLALELHRRWLEGTRGEGLPPAVELEIAHEILRRGRVEEAERAYRRYLEAHPRSPDSPEAKFRLALILSRAVGDRAQARELFRQAAAEHPDPETAAFARRELEGL